jgi:hypothetical protein
MECGNQSKERENQTATQAVKVISDDAEMCWCSFRNHPTM